MTTNPIALDLLKLAEHYLSALHGSVARHDNLGLNLSCGGCALRDEIRDVLPKLAAVVPGAPATRTADRIAEALYAHNHPGWATRYTDLDQDERDTYLARADAVLAVLPPPVDRAAVLREAADAPAAECSAQHHRFDDGRLCIRAAQHRGDHIDERGYHWSDTVAIYPLADGTVRTGVNLRAELRRMADEAQQRDTEAPADPKCVCGHPVRLHHEDVCLTADCDCVDCLEPEGPLPDRLEAVLTRRFTELGNPFSRMSINFQGPDGWPASKEVGPHDVAEVLRELLADEASGARRAADDEQPDGTRPESCAHCGKAILRRSGTLSVWWVHDPGGHTMCVPTAGGDSPCATPKPAAGARQDDPPVVPCPPGCVACATDESHDPAPAARARQDGAQQ